MTLLALLLALAGFALLALAMDRHARDLLGRLPPMARRRRMRIGATGALLAAYALAVADWGAVLGSIFAYAILSLAAAGVLLVASHRAAR